MYVLEKEYDVLVIGGGIAGVASALSAKRENKSVCIIEKSVVLGGLATLGLVNWFEPLCDGTGEQLIYGITEELLKLAIKDGFNDLDEKWLKKEKVSIEDKRYATHFSPTLYSVYLNKLLYDEGIFVRYDSLATYPIMERGLIKGVEVETVSGKEFYKAKVVIDATGNATIFDRAGAKCETGLNYLSYLSYISDFSQPIEKREQTRRWIYSGGNMVGRGQPEDVPLLKGVSSDDVNTMINRGQRILFGKMQDLKNSEIINLTGMPQFRMIRHMVGEYELTGEDVYKEFEDSVGVIGNYLKREEWYEIPFRALYNKDYPNLLPAGRIISATGKAWDVTRVIPVCALTGEVAGVVASMLIDEKVEVKDVSVKKLQENLTKRGIKLYKRKCQE